MRRVPASMSGDLHRRAGYLLITTALPTIVAAAGLLLAPAAQADGCQPSGIGTNCSIAAGDTLTGLALTSWTNITSELDSMSSAPVDLVSAGGGGEAQPGGAGGPAATAAELAGMETRVVLPAAAAMSPLR